MYNSSLFCLSLALFFYWQYVYVNKAFLHKKLLASTIDNRQQF